MLNVFKHLSSVADMLGVFYCDNLDVCISYHLIWYNLINCYQNSLGPVWPPHVIFCGPVWPPHVNFCGPVWPPHENFCGPRPPLPQKMWRGGRRGGRPAPPYKIPLLETLRRVCFLILLCRNFMQK